MKSMNIIRMSSNGQIVISSGLRNSLMKGEEVMITNDNESFILKKANALTEEMKEDLEFARRTEEALKRHERGKFISVNEDEFLKELEKW